MLWRLARRIPDTTTLYTIALDGLHIEYYMVQTELNNHRGDISSAALAVLQCWKKNHEDLKAAYVELCNALRSVNMGFYIALALQPNFFLECFGGENMQNLK